MIPSHIYRRRQTLLKRLERDSGELDRLKLMCQHGDLIYKYGANTGNYDPSEDCYWTDWTCKVCGYKWQTDQSVRYKNVKAQKE